MFSVKPDMTPYCGLPNQGQPIRHWLQMQEAWPPHWTAALKMDTVPAAADSSQGCCSSCSTTLLTST